MKNKVYLGKLVKGVLSEVVCTLPVIGAGLILSALCLF